MTNKDKNSELLALQEQIEKEDLIKAVAIEYCSMWLQYKGDDPQKASDEVEKRMKLIKKYRDEKETRGKFYRDSLAKEKEQIEKLAISLFDTHYNYAGNWKWEKENITSVYEYWRKLAKAAIAAMKPQESWQPIETAPKNGTNILVWWPNEFHCPLVAHWNNGKYNGDKIGWKLTAWSNSKETEPTHWMPLPQPPKQKEGNK